MTDGQNLRDGRYAAIDIGTVTCRLMVADVINGRICVLDKEYRICNLGEGVDASRRLLPQAMERVHAALQDFIAVRDTFNMAAHPVLATMTTATSAARDAENSQEFEAMLGRLGIHLHVISGAVEAALTFAGASARYASEPVMVVDVGGGSTEVSFGEGGGAIRASKSFDIGCRRMTERFLQDDPPTPEQLRAAFGWAQRSFAEWIEEQKTAGTLNARDLSGRMLAVAGTATSVVSIRERMEEYDSTRVNGATVTLEELREITENLAACTLEQRRNIVGLDPGRAPVIVAGLLILQAIMCAAGKFEFSVSESDILDGMIMRLASKRR